MDTVDRFRGMLDAECGLSPLTIDTYLRDVRAFLAFCGDCPITREHVAEYFQAQPWENATLKRMGTPLRTFFAFIGRDDLVWAVPSIRSIIPSPKPISEEACDALRAVMSDHQPIYAQTAPRTLAVFELLYGCGLRISELCGLTLRSFDMAFHKLRVWGKGNRERIVTMDDRPYEALCRYLDEWRPRHAVPNVDRIFISRSGTPMSRTDVTRMIRQRAWFGGLPATSAHTLRHSYATHRMEHDDPLPDIQKAMGHSALSVTQRYLAVSPGRMRRVMENCHPSFQVESGNGST